MMEIALYFWSDFQFTWQIIVRLKKQALAAASFPTSRQLVKKALALAQALAAASFPRSRQLSKLPPSLRAACAPVAS